MDSQLMLATAGDDIKLWDCNGYTLVKQFNPHANSIQSVAWSHDNHSLASTSGVGDKVVLSYLNAGNHSTTLSGKEARCRTCVAYSSNSRYLAGGGTDSVIYVWDLKSQKVKNVYKGLNGSITTLQFNYNDTVIASGSESGEIMLYNVVTGIGYTPLTTPKAQTVRQLQYSYLKKTLLGSVSDDGAVYLWDTNSKRILHAFDDAHKAPASGLAFSPVNHMLLLSVGLDKQIICHDVLANRIVKRMVTENALTSIDIFHDGSTLAVGSSRGKAFVYDLRQGANPISTMSAHKTSVSCVRFQKNIVVPESVEPSGRPLQSDKSVSSAFLTDSNNANAVRASPLRNSLNSSSNTLERARNGLGSVPVTSKESKEKDLLVNGKEFDCGDVFSPIRDVYSTDVATNAFDTVKKESDLVRAPNVVTQSMISPLRDDVVQKDAEPVRAMTTVLSAISPLRNDELSLSSPASSSVLSAGRINNSLPDLTREATRPFGADAFSPLGIQNSSIPLQSELSATKSGHQTVASPFNTVSYLAKKLSPPRTVHNSSVTVPSAVTPPDAAPSFDPGLETSASAAGSKEAVASVTRSKDVAAEAVPPSSSAASSNSFQMEFLVNAVRDVMEDFQDQIHQDVMNLHLELLKQFEIQKMETKKMLEMYSLNSELVAEIQRLREENARLKKNY